MVLRCRLRQPAHVSLFAGPLVQGYFSVITEIFDDSGRPHTLVSPRASRLLTL